MQCIRCNAQINVNDAACSGCNEPIVFGIDGLGKGFKKHPPGLWLPCSNVPKQTERQGSTNRAGSSNGANGEAQEENSGKHAAHKSDLLHYTLNTGHTSTVARTHVPDYAIDQAKSMLITGRHPIKLAINGYECEVTIQHHGLIATVFQGQRPLVTFGVAPNDESAEQIWGPLTLAYALYNDATKLKQQETRRPERTPWCAVVVAQMRQEEFWVANVEQMMAWAWIEKIRSSDAK